MKRHLLAVYPFVKQGCRNVQLCSQFFPPDALCHVAEKALLVGFSPEEHVAGLGPKGSYCSGRYEPKGLNPGSQLRNDTFPYAKNIPKRRNGVGVDFAKGKIRIGGREHDVLYVLFAAG